MVDWTDLFRWPPLPPPREPPTDGEMAAWADGTGVAMLSAGAEAGLVDPEEVPRVDP